MEPCRRSTVQWGMGSECDAPRLCDDPRYRLIERTLLIRERLGGAQRQKILALLGRPDRGGTEPSPRLAIELTEDPQAGAVLAYLDEQRLRHEVHEIYGWVG